MLKLCLFPALLSLALVAAAGDSSDAVNERLPVRKDELERHWGVDCGATWQQLKDNSGSDGILCEVSPELLLALRLCGFIYQPPGQSTTHRDPDYVVAVEALQNKNCHQFID